MSGGTIALAQPVVIRTADLDVSAEANTAGFGIIEPDVWRRIDVAVDEEVHDVEVGAEMPLIVAGPSSADLGNLLVGLETVRKVRGHWNVGENDNDPVVDTLRGVRRSDHVGRNRRTDIAEAILILVFAGRLDAARVAEALANSGFTFATKCIARDFIAHVAAFVRLAIAVVVLVVAADLGRAGVNRCGLVIAVGLARDVVRRHSLVAIVAQDH